MSVAPPQQSRPGQGEKKASIGAFALSVILHGFVLFLVGGYVIFEGVLPKTPFIPVDGPVDGYAEDTVMPEPQEVIDSPEAPSVNQDLSSEPVVQAQGEVTSSDILVASSPGTPTFSLPPAVGTPTSLPKLGSGAGSSPDAKESNASPMPNQGKIIRSLFGTSEQTPNALVGTFYDIGRDRKGVKRNKDAALALARRLGEEAVKERGSPKVFNEVFMAPQKLFASQFLFPRATTSGAYEAFGEKPITEFPSFWVHYSARVVPPESGRFRFTGYGDDYVIVLVDGKPVMIADNMLYDKNPENARTKSTKGAYGWESPVDLIPVKWNKFCRYTLGDWIDWKKEDAKRVDIFIGDSYGQFVAFVGIDQEGKKYDKTDDGVPVLPPFRLDNRKVDRDQFKSLLSEGVDFTERGGPVFQVR